jgi:hypothetical protein
MSRSSIFFPIAALLGPAGCGVGEFGPSNNMTTDGGGTNDRDLCAAKAAPGTPYMHTTEPTGTRAGMGCIAAGCHIPNSGTAATAFAFAGTVYKDEAGTTAQPGVVVRIFNTSGNTMKSIAQAVTDSAGNFVIRPAAGMFESFPYSTDVTACGTDAVAKGIRPMIAPIAKSDANCNGGGTCHVVPKVAGAPIFLKD